MLHLLGGGVEGEKGEPVSPCSSLGRTCDVVSSPVGRTYDPVSSPGGEPVIRSCPLEKNLDAVSFPKIVSSSA